MVDLPPELTDVWRTAAATLSVDELAAALLDVAGGARLYLADRELDLLVAVDAAPGAGGGAAPPGEVALEGELLDAVLAGRPLHVGGGIWTPLADLSLPIGAVWQPAATGTREPGPAVVPTWATLAGVLLSRRIEVLDELERRRRRAPMAPAAQLQWDQLTTRALAHGPFRAAGTLVPAYEVAGDMFDLAVDTEGVLQATVLDAMGHGVTATTSAVLALAAMRTVRRDGGTLAEQAAAADDAVAAEWGGDRFVTMVVAAFDLDGVRIVNAGHEPVRLIDADGVRTLDVPADPPLGVERPTAYRTTTLAPLGPGATLCMLSDGSPEARPAGGPMLGETGVNALLQRCRTGVPLARSRRFTRLVLEAVGLDEPEDDVAAVMIERAADV